MFSSTSLLALLATNITSTKSVDAQRSIRSLLLLMRISSLSMCSVRASLPTSEGGNKYLLRMIDLFTRFGVAAPIADQTAHTVVDTMLAQWSLLFGDQRRIISDHGGTSSGCKSRTCVHPGESITCGIRHSSLRATEIARDSTTGSSEDCSVFYTESIWSSGM